MRVLLIGKYPPIQGGVASTAYWESRELKERYDISWSVATCRPSTCYTAGLEQPLADVPTIVVDTETAQERPWFIPGDDLLIAALASAGIRLAEANPPSLVMSNYLAPFGVAGWIVASLLKLPLVLRPAGSDVEKLLTWEPVTPVLKKIVDSASLLILNQSRQRAFTEMLSTDRVYHLPRYRPSPLFHSDAATPSNRPTLLVAGKIPYRWRLKALDTVFEAVGKTANWSVHLLCDGEYLDSMYAEARRWIPPNRLTAEVFIGPDQMPAVLSRHWATWAGTHTGGVEDFPNLAWESVATQRVCLLSESQRQLAMQEAIPLNMIRFVDPGSASSIACALDSIDVPVFQRPANVDCFHQYESYYSALADALRLVCNGG